MQAPSVGGHVVDDITAHLDAALHKMKNTVATAWHITEIDKVDDKLQVLNDLVLEIYESRGHSPKFRD